MVMRARGGGAAAPNRGRPGGVQPVFEEFKPKSEWQKDDESHILVIHLPSFMKEQIKVSTEGRNTIRVRGERLVAGNKWSRFQEDFQIPENGEISSVRAKFLGGSLFITVPRKIDKPQDQPLPPKTSTTSVETQKQPTTPQKEQQKVLPATGTSQTTHDKRPEPQKASNTDPIKNVTPLRNTGTAAVLPPAVDKIEKGKNSTLPEKEDKTVVEKMVEKETGKGSERSKELLEEKKTGEFEKDGPLAYHEGKEKDKESRGKETNDYDYSSRTADDHGVSTIGKKSKRAVKGIAELNEERQLLVNVGVAVLVIAAFSAYVTYNFASGKDQS